MSDEFEEIKLPLDKEAAAQMAELMNKPELASLIRGNVTPQELAEAGMQRSLVEYAETLGGVVLSNHITGEEGNTPEELERKALEHAINMDTHRQAWNHPFRQLSSGEADATIEVIRANPNLMRPIVTVAPLEQRIMPLLNAINDKLENIQATANKMEEEIMFTSSSNRFAHLRSGIEKGTIPHLPPAPDWNTLEAYVEPFLQNIIDHIQGTPILRERATTSGLLPMDVLRGVDIVGKELLQIVRERGKQYGEEAILAMGEAGLIGMIVSKVMRLMWSHRGGAQFLSRRDSYIDLAGYCLLTISLDQFITENSEKEEQIPNIENGNMG